MYQSIERVLEWAYRHELPKGYHSDRERFVRSPSISPMFKYAALGGPVDNWSREPGFPIAMGTEPHPDALAVHNAVMGIEEEVSIVWKDAADVLLGDELARHVSADDLPAIRRIRAQPRGLVSLHARMGNRPIWNVEFERVRVVGKDRRSPIRKGKVRRSKNLQGEWRLSVEPVLIVEARFEYLCWIWALGLLAHELRGLSRLTPTQPEAPQAPWFTGEQQPVILSDAVAMDAKALATGRTSMLARLPLKPSRPRTLPVDRQRHGPVIHCAMEPAE